MPHQPIELTAPDGTLIYHKGPPLEQGALPSLIYFALTAEESLLSDPYNQPIKPLEKLPVRVFSFNLPLHRPGVLPAVSIDLWAKEFLEGNDPLTPFITACKKSLDYLIASGWVEPRQLAVAGLSRGAFIASHLAALDPRIQCIAGFAPLISLDKLELFAHNPPYPAQMLSLMDKIPQLIGRRLNFFIGNRDLRVGTETVFNFIYRLAEASSLQGIRSPRVELHLYPSVGYKGHGTPKEIFELGSNWLINQLESVKIV